MDTKEYQEYDNSYANYPYTQCQSESGILSNWEGIEPKLRELFSNQVDADILLLITRLNRGDAQNAIKNSISRLKSSAKLSELKDLKIQIENQIKRQLGDKQKRFRLKNCLKESAIKIVNQLNKIQINETFLLSCLGQKISCKVLEIITEYAKVLASECEGGPTYQNLQDQIKQIMSLVLPQIKNQVPEIKKIIQNKSFNHIYQLHEVTRSNQQKFISCVNCLISFQNHLKFGVNFNEATNKFVLAVLQKIIPATKDWQKWIFIIQNLVEDPLFDFSENGGFTAEMLKKIYTEVYDLKEYNNYLQLINIPNSLKSRQKRDIQKIIKQINDRLRQKQEKQLRNILENYDYAELYKNQYIGVVKMRKIYNFIQKNCQDYIKYQKQNDTPIDEMKRKLVIELRKYLLQIEVPFSLYKNIQKLVFENKVYDLLEQALSNSQKKLLFSWIRKNMSVYYKLQFAEGTLRNETQQKLIGIIINLNLNLDYDSIVNSIKKFLDEISPDSLYDSKYFNVNQSQSIKKATQNSDTILNYINNNGIDLSQIRFKAQNSLLYDILVCNQIGFLSGEIVKGFIKQYLQKPQDETVRKSDISLSQQEKLIQIISKVKDLEEYKQQMKKLNVQLSIKKFKQKLNTQLNDPQLLNNIWSLYEKYGRLNFSNNQLDMKQQDDEVNQVKEALRKEQNGLIQTFSQIQNSEQYYQFRYQYPEIIQRKYKQLEKNILIDFKEILKRKSYKNDLIQEFCKSAQDKQYRLSELKTMTKFRKMVQITQGLQRYKTYSSLKDESQQQQRFIEEIQKEKQIAQFLQDKRFEKYSAEEKKSVIDLYRYKGDQFIEFVSQIFTKIDAEAVQQRFSENQHYQQKNTRQQISPIKLKPMQRQRMTQPRKKQEEKPSPTKKPKIVKSKTLEISEWKQQLQKTIKRTYDELVYNRQLLTVAGQQLKKYEKKDEILNQYQQLLNKARKNAEEQFFKAIQEQEQSNIRSLESYEKIKSNLNGFIVDFSLAQLDVQLLKQNYQIKTNSKVKKIKQELNSREKQLKKIKQINQEIKKLESFKSG